MTKPSRTKLILAAALAVVAAVLFLLDATLPASIDQRAEIVRGQLPDINTAVDTLLARHGIGRERVKTWQVQTPDKKFIRVERRVYVPPEFVSVKFNHDLNRMMRDFGALAVATERTKENTVTMHIKKDERIIESITFVVKNE
ncbi:MAG: hypothetical protein ACKVRP_15515 [Bacteroidota bacterium]